MGAEITIEGNAGGDPVRKQVGERTVVEFSVAVTNKRRGEKVTTWFRVSDWDGVTEDVAVTKGQRVKVTGPFFARTYQSKDGERTSLEVSAKSVELVEWEDRGEKAEPEKAAPKPKRAPTPFDDDTESIPF